MDAAAAAAADQSRTLALGPELTIAHAAAARETLLAALHAGRGDLLLALDGVTDFDSAGIQLLLAARRSLAERGDALRIASASAAVREALATFGLPPLLADPA